MKEEMENKLKIGKAFSDGLKDMSLEPNPVIWEQVSKNIPNKPNNTFGKSWIAPIAVVAVVASIIIGYMIFSAQEQIIPDNNIVENNVNTPQTNSNKEIANIQSQVDSVVDVENNSINNVSEKTNLIDLEPCGDKPKDEEIKIQPKKPELTQEKPNLVINSNPKPVIIKTSHTDNSQEPINQTTVAKPEPIKHEIKIDTNIIFSSDPTICFGENARLNVDGGEYYLWSNGSGSNAITVEPVNNSTYSVTVTDKYNYQHVHEFSVSIDKECTTIYLPNAFTPNGDGNNDIFKALGENILEFSMQIMNREGRIIFTTNDINTGWDGTFNGNPLPSQVYIYSIVYKNGRGVHNTLKGQVTLIR